MFIFNANGYTGKYAWVCATRNTATVGGLTNGGSYLAVVYATTPTGGHADARRVVIAGTPAPPAA